jgi:PAS domain-containing protein
MKKYIIWLLAIVTLIVFVNIIFSVSVYNDALGLRKQQMSASAERASSNIENEIASFKNSVNSILFSKIIDNLDIRSEDRTQEGLKMLEILFTRYNKLIANISIYDPEGNILNLSSGRNGLLIIDPYTTQKNSSLEERELFKVSGTSPEYIIPVFKDSLLYANIIFQLNLNDYLKDKIDNEFMGENSFWWFIGQSGEIYYSDMGPDAVIQDIESVLTGIKEEASDFLKHDISADLSSYNMLSLFYPVNLFSEKYGIMVSIPRQSFMTALAGKTLAPSLISLLILLLSVTGLLLSYRKQEKSNNNLKTELSYFNNIFNILPIGIIGFDSRKRAKLINQAAKDILMIDSDEDVAGKSLEERFMLSRDYYDNAVPSAYDSEQYVVYRHQGEEISVYKKDVPFMLNNEEYIISAFIDISHIEKSRKYEAAANTAKSEFLARMSHEIRTPMNGIIGMTDALSKEFLNDDQKEKIFIIRKSADLLLSLIDDILDFSKIEAGKMQIEEIPFRLRDEVKVSLELFRL